MTRAIAPANPASLTDWFVRRIISRAKPPDSKTVLIAALQTAMAQSTMILVIDNYDSFTFNLVHYLMELGVEVRVERNDALSASDALATNAAGFLISPGPCTPNEAGISLDLVAACADRESPCWVCAWVTSLLDSTLAVRLSAAG